MPERIHELAHKLKAELAAADELDADTRQRLEQLAHEIDSAADPDTDDQFMPDSLEDLERAALTFEAEHPRVAGVLRSIADTLTKMGI